MAGSRRSPPRGIFFKIPKSRFMNFINYLFPGTIKWPRIEGEKIYLERFNLIYVENLKKFLSDKDLIKFSFGIPGEFEAKKVVDDYLEQIARNKGKTLGIFLRESGRFIGIIHASFVNYFIGNYKLGIMIGETSSQNKGIGKDAVKTILKFIFSSAKASYVTLETASFNARAQKCFEACGFKKIETFDEVEEFTKKTSTKFLYKITRQEYQGKNQEPRTK